MPEGHSRVKACTECQQQKQRCDAYKDYSQPCSRCKKMSLGCVISSTYKRTKRQTKTDLRRELDTLKKQVQPHLQEGSSNQRNLSLEGPVSSNADGMPQAFIVAPDQSDTFPLDAVAGSSSSTSAPTHQSSWSSTGRLPSDSVTTELAGSAGTYNATGIQANFSPNSRATELLGQGGSALSASTRWNGSSSITRTLGNVEIDGKKSMDCFAIFHQHYAPLVPGIFDADVSPDRCYQQSTFLFWAIICTGARTYTKDPTILDRLAKKITDLALPSVCSNLRPIPTIQAIILLCSWPLPINTLYKDPSHALAGAAIHLAIQNGLHIFCREQDFASRPAKRQDNPSSRPARLLDPQIGTQSWCADSEICFRARLWTHCLTIFQSTSLCDGLPFPLVPEFLSVQRSQELHSVLAPNLSYRYKLHRIQTDAVSAIRHSLDLETPGTGPSLNSLIDMFDGQVQEATPVCIDDTILLMRSFTRVSIRAFHFFVATEHIDQYGFLQLYSVACETIGLASKLDIAQDFGTYMDHYSSRMVILAAYCILRIFKGHLRERFDLSVAEEMFFKAIAISKKRSIQNNDLDAINANMLTQLWSSNTIFSRTDGSTNSIQLDLRGRLFMSVVFDCFWWWRKEFGSLKDSDEAHINAPKFANVQNDHQTGISPQSTGIFQDGVNGAQIEQGLFPDPNFNFFDYPDWDWTTTLATLDDSQLMTPAMD